MTRIEACLEEIENYFTVIKHGTVQSAMQNAHRIVFYQEIEEILEHIKDGRLSKKIKYFKRPDSSVATAWSQYLRCDCSLEQDSLIAMLEEMERRLIKDEKDLC